MQFELIRKILYIQYKPFGDVLCNTGVLPFIRKRFPHATLDYVVQHPCQQILKHNSHIDELLIFQRGQGLTYALNRLKLCLNIRRRKYDLIIDQMSGTGSAQMAFLSGARYRIGYGDSRRRWAYNVHTSRGPARYSAATKFDLLKPLGISEQPYRLEYTIEPESIRTIDSWLVSVNMQDTPSICIAPGSKAAYKTWKAESFAQVADYLLTQTLYKVILLWADYEWDAVQRMVAAMQQEPIIAPRTNLNEGAALLRRVRLLIGNDTALNHLSAVTCTPSLAFFGRTRPIDWSPTTDPHHYYLYHPERYREGDNSFGISAQEAVEKVKEILDDKEVLNSSFSALAPRRQDAKP
jgi:ADP-heptose:LPS heptosyltransferase